MSLRILFVTHGPADPRTAVFLNVTSRAEHLRRDGHTVDIVTPPDVGVRRMAGIGPLLFGLAVALRARPFSYDLVVFHSHSAWPSIWLRPLVARAGRTRMIVSFHGLEPLYHAVADRELARRSGGRGYSRRFHLLHRVLLHRLLASSCRHADAALCLNTAERDYLVEHVWSAADRVCIVANGIEPSMLAARAHEGRGARLVFLGQWLAAKGTASLVAAFTTVAGEDADVRLVCAGTGASADTVLTEFPEYLRDRVTVLPSLDREGIGNLLHASDVFVCPSLSEGFSGALLESMAAGLAIAATPAGAAADILTHGDNALIVPFSDSVALASAIRRLVGDAALRQRLGAAAHRTAQSFQWSAVNADYARTLMEVVRTGSASGDRRPRLRHHAAC